MAEVRVMNEGALRFVQASGSGRTWATGATPPSGLWGYVQSFSYTSAQTIATIMERGTPDHHKLASKTPVDVTFNYFWTGGRPVALSSSGATMPLYHFEHRASAAEIGNGTTGVYHQFIGAALISTQFTEQAEGNVIAETYRCLAIVANTGSGYLS